MSAVYERAAPANRARGQLIAVASGKGGVGKTWLSITLAHALAQAGQRVLLFDGDLGLANVDVQLGLLPRQELAAALHAGEDPLSAIVPYAPGGFDVLAGRSGSGALASLSGGQLEVVLDAMDRAVLHYGTVLMDLGAGLDRPVRRLAAAADRLLVVATDEPTSLTDAYAVLKLHAADTAKAQEAKGRARAAQVAVVMNQAPTHAAGERGYATLARVAEAFLGAAPPLAGIVRRDDRVREAIRHQRLLLTRWPASPAAADVMRLAAAVGAGAQASAAMMR